MLLLLLRSSELMSFWPMVTVCHIKEIDGVQLSLHLNKYLILKIIYPLFLPKSPIIVVQLLSHVQFFATPWTAACQAPLSSTVSQILHKFTSNDSVMLSNGLILCCPPLPLPSIFHSIRVFSNESVHIRWPSIGALASVSVLPMNRQGWFPLGLTSLISLQSYTVSKYMSFIGWVSGTTFAQEDIRGNINKNNKLRVYQCFRHLPSLHTPSTWTLT